MFRKMLIRAAVLYCCIGCSFDLPAQHNQTAAWDRLSPYFSVPAGYQNQFGNYRSLLNFYNGQPVRSKSDWIKRRAELHKKWTELLGAWPPLIKRQQLRVLKEEKREDFRQLTVSLEWIPGDTTHGYLLIPEKAGTKPAVITVFYEPETAIGRGKPDRDFAYQLVKRGFMALSLGTARATMQKTYSLFYPDIRKAEIQPLSTLAYAAANAFEALSVFKDVDPGRIGIMGHSFGGKWALFASCLYEKFACAAWSDPGIVFDETRSSVNYWEPYYLGYHTPPWRKRGDITASNPAKGLYLELRKAGHDLHELHALMAPRPFLVSGGSEDPENRWIPLNRTIQVNKLLGYTNNVGMSNREQHSPDAASNEIIYSFFEHFLTP